MNEYDHWFHTISHEHNETKTYNTLFTEIYSCSSHYGEMYLLAFLVAISFFFFFKEKNVRPEA